MPAERSPAEAVDAGPALRGEVVYLFAFDVANEIRLDRAAELLPSAPPKPPARSDRTAPRDLPAARPLVVEPATPARLRGTPVRLRVAVYDVGVVSVSARVAFAADSLAGLGPFHHAGLDDGRPLDALAREHCDAVTRAVADALVRSGSVTEPEAYTVFCLTHLGGESDATRWLDARPREVAGLLTATPADRLSDAQVADVLRLRRSFEKSDLVVVDWDAALVVDLGGGADEVVFVLELANLQLEEFRWMDGALDRHLDDAYEQLNRRRWWRFGDTAAVLRSLWRMRIDLARLADEVAHATKFVGDWHLARVYQLARERFHLDQWRASVGERLAELDRLYTLTRGELHDRRMLWLEVIIVVFFAVDLLLLLAK
jgi:hypothetical protein